MAIEENMRPPRKAISGIRMNSWLEIKPKAATTARTMVELIRLLVAPHRSSPAMTSSMLIGVVMMASKVFW